jgi:tetratricopeptide (TPR) repeat protein
VIASFVPRLQRQRWRVAALAIGLLLSAFGTAHAAKPAAPDQLTAAADLHAQEMELRASLSKDPNDASSHLKLGRLYIELGNFPAATDQARAAHRSAIYRDDADALLSWALFLQNQFAVLLREVKPGNRKPQAEGEVRMSLGLAMLNTQGADKAASLLQDAVRVDPSSWRAHIALARVLILLRKLPDARRQIEGAQLLAPNESGVIRIAAELDRASGDATGAIAKFNEVLRTNPSSMPALAGRADAWISLDKLSKAQNDINAALALRPRSPHSNVIFLGTLLLAREGKFAEARRLLEKAQSLFERMPIGLYLYGILNYELGYLEIANASLANFHVRQPNASTAMVVRAVIALRRKDPAGAIRMLEPLIATNPGDPLVVTMLARAYVRNGQPEQAIEMYTKIGATPKPRGPQPIDGSGLMMIYGDAQGDLIEIEKVIMRKMPDTVLPMLALRDGDVAKASKMAEELADTRSNAWIQNLLGTVRMAQQRLPEAEAIFRTILEKEPEFSTAAFGLAQVLVAEKRPQEATAVLKTVTHRMADDGLI